MRLQDALVLGGLSVVADKQFLIELLARAQSGYLDGDVAVRVVGIAHSLARKLDRPPRQLQNPHRLSHIQHKHVAARRHGGPGCPSGAGPS